MNYSDIATGAVIQDPAVRQILQECCYDTGKFAKTFLPEQFDAPFSEEIHYDIIRRFDRMDVKREVIMAPRGIGKTSIARALAMRKILFGQARFVVYVQNSSTLATMQTENIKREFIRNKLMRKIWGSPKDSISMATDEDFQGMDDSDFDESFSKQAWVAYGRTLVLPRGTGQPIRGLLFRHHRPDLVIVDDAEDMEEITNDEIRKKNYEWILTDVARCINMTKDDWKIIYIDTLKHEDAVLARLSERQDWESVTKSIMDDKMHSYAPEFMNDEEIQEEMSAHRAAGTLDLFYREMCNQVIAGETAAFRPSYFRYFDPEHEQFNMADVESFVLVDPAKTSNPTSADSAIVGVTVNYKTQCVYVRDVVAGKLNPDEMYDEVFKMADRLNCKTIGLEVTGLNEHITFPFKNAMLRRAEGIYTIIELHARKGEGQYSKSGKGKDGRIASMIPFYRTGLIVHNPNCCSELEHQLLNFPRSKRKDIMDALAYFVQLFELGGRYFGMGEGEEPTVEELDAEYAEFEQEDGIMMYEPASFGCV